METAKKCSVCKTIKNKSEFGRNKTHKDGFSSSCKKCEWLSKRTKHGLITKIYSNQKQHSRKRGHAAPTYTKQDLEEWLFSQSLFHELYDNWKRLDYQRMYSPSVNRKNNFIGYTISNIELMTWAENRREQSRDMALGRSTSAKKIIVNPHRGISEVSGAFYPRIFVDKVYLNLGRFDNIDDAILARLEAEKIYYGK